VNCHNQINQGLVIYYMMIFDTLIIMILAALFVCTNNRKINQILISGQTISIILLRENVLNHIIRDHDRS
jgi:hypothetical protein